MQDKTPEELVKLLTLTRTSLREHRFSAAGARAKDASAKRKMRATVARILTEQNRRLASSPVASI